MHPLAAVALFGGLLFLVGRRSRRERGDPTGEPGEQLSAILDGADTLFAEARDAFGAPIPTTSAHETNYAGASNGPIPPLGN